MKKHTQQFTGLMVLGVLLASCGSMQPVSQVRDDIYFMPSEAPPTASIAPTKPTPPAPHEMEVVEDYFDQGTSQELGTSRSFYDMAYNDPHYYNYGRFGFGSGMGMGGMGMGGMGMGFMSGWNGPGWGMSMGYGWGSGMGMGGMGMGGMGWGSPYGWYDPWDPWNRWDPWNPYNRWNRWNRPWGMGGMGWGMNPYGGWGMGNYWGPFGNCMACYAPVVVGGSSNTYIGHRSSMGAGGGSATGGGRGSYQPRMPLRDPVSLDPVRREAARPQTATRQDQQLQGRDRDRSFPSTTPRNDTRSGTTPRTAPDQRSNAPQLDRGNQQRTTPARTTPQRTAPQRTAPERSSPQQRSGGFDRGSSPSVSPSRGGGGGGGGGSRPSGGGRPR